LPHEILEINWSKMKISDSAAQFHGIILVLWKSHVWSFRDRRIAGCPRTRSHACPDGSARLPSHSLQRGPAPLLVVFVRH